MDLSFLGYSKHTLEEKVFYKALHTNGRIFLIPLISFDDYFY